MVVLCTYATTASPAAVAASLAISFHHPNRMSLHAGVRRFCLLALRILQHLQAGHKHMAIGIHDFNQPKQVTWLHSMLILPFIGKVTGYTINSRYQEESEK